MNLFLVSTALDSRDLSEECDESLYFRKSVPEPLPLLLLDLDFRVGCSESAGAVQI